MKPISVIRRANLAELVRQAGGQAPFGEKIGKDKNQVYQWLIEDESNPQARNFTHTTARAIEAKCGKPPGWMDVEHNGGEVFAGSQPARLTGSMIRAAFKEARQFAASGGATSGDFNPETDADDAGILAVALNRLLSISRQDLGSAEHG